MTVLQFRELIVWKKSVGLVTEIYQFSARFPKEEIFGLTSQLRRAAVSVPANIAEGQGRQSRGEFRQFLGNARGSLFELETHVQIAMNLGYLSNENACRLNDGIHEVGRLLNGLLKSLEAA